LFIQIVLQHQTIYSKPCIWYGIGWFQNDIFRIDTLAGNFALCTLNIYDCLLSFLLALNILSVFTYQIAFFNGQEKCSKEKLRCQSSKWKLLTSLWLCCMKYLHQSKRIDDGHKLTIPWLWVNKIICSL
jgi:hypothetical protein